MSSRLLASLTFVFAVSVCAAEELCVPDQRGEILMQTGSYAFIPPQLVAGSSVRVPRPPVWMGEEISFTFWVGLDGKPDISSLEMLVPSDCAPYRFEELPEDLQRFMVRLLQPLRYHPATRANKPVVAELAAPIQVPIFYTSLNSNERGK